MKLSSLIECPVCGVKKRYRLRFTTITNCRNCQKIIVIKKVESIKSYSVGVVENV